MKQNAATQIELTDHAYIRYCERVGMIDHERLKDKCQQHFTNRTYGTQKKRFIEFDGIWWAYIVNKRGVMVLVTCYGKSSLDVPRALAWSAIHNDFVNLSVLEVLT